MSFPAAISLVLAGWHPFVTPAPIWGAWWVLLLPLLLGIALVWKATRCRRPGDIPRETLVLWLYMLGAFLAGAIVLGLLVRIVL